MYFMVNGPNEETIRGVFRRSEKGEMEKCRGAFPGVCQGGERRKGREKKKCSGDAFGGNFFSANAPARPANQCGRVTCGILWRGISTKK